MRPLPPSTGWISAWPQPSLFKSSAHLIHREGLGRGELHHGAAAELHPQVAVAPAQLHKGHDAQDDEHPGDDKGVTRLPMKSRLGL